MVTYSADSTRSLLYPTDRAREGRSADTNSSSKTDSTLSHSILVPKLDSYRLGGPSGLHSTGCGQHDPKSNCKQLQMTLLRVTTGANTCAGRREAEHLSIYPCCDKGCLHIGLHLQYQRKRLYPSTWHSPVCNHNTMSGLGSRNAGESRKQDEQKVAQMVTELQHST